MTYEIIIKILTILGASIGATSLLSLIWTWALSRRINKTKIKIGNAALQLNTSKGSDELYDQVCKSLTQLKQHPQVFLLYQHKQRDFVIKLSHDLQKAGIKVWIDSRELKPGDFITSNIQRGIKESQWVLFIPPEGKEKKGWVYKELQLAFKSERQRERPFIIPIKLHHAHMPETLKDRLWVDFSNNYADGFKSLLRGIVRTSEIFLSFSNERLVSDIKAMKDNLKKQLEADTQKKVSEAIVAANKANLPKRKVAFVKAELRKKEVEAAKTEVDATAIELKAKRQYEKDIEDATTRLLEAQSKIVQKGGRVIFDKTNLQRIYENCQNRLVQLEESPHNYIKGETLRLPEIYLNKTKAGLDKVRKPLKYIDNKYELQDNVVYDKATGLTWQQSGTDNKIPFGFVDEYIADLNREKYAGYSDWRLPTLAEAKTLLEPHENKTNLCFINHIFDSTQSWIWTSDLNNASRTWIVSSYNGCCYSIDIDQYFAFVRAVR